jgi:hypothetical protein
MHSPLRTSGLWREFEALVLECEDESLPSLARRDNINGSEHISCTYEMTQG